MKNVLITTTPTLEGYNIERYFQPITSHIVIGTNIFSDMFAGLSDFFGGRSETYQRKLREINDAAMKQISETAATLGANAVLGYHVYINEISGKNKNMFMITAFGTAVIATKQETKAEALHPKQKSGLIDSITLEYNITHTEILNQIQTKELKITTENIDRIIEHHDTDIIIYLLKYYDQNYNFVPNISQNLISGTAIKAKIEELFTIIDTDLAMQVIYQFIKTNEETTLTSFISTLIEKNSLIDLSEIHTLLLSGKQHIKIFAVSLLRFNKQYYSAADAQAYQQILDILKAYPKAEIFIEKGGMLTKDKEMWKCSCGGKVDATKSTCGYCAKDWYGFNIKTVNFVEIINTIENRIKFINAHFNS